MSIKFNYHEEAKKDRAALLPWVVVNGMGDHFDELSELSEKFNKCELAITLNGIELDVPSILKGIEHTLEYQSEKRALQVTDEITKEFDYLEDLLSVTRRTVERAIRDRLSEKGIEIPEIDDYS